MARAGLSALSCKRPLAEAVNSGLRSSMFWWDWTGKQRFMVLLVMLCIAAAPWILLGWLPREIGAFVGGTAFLMIPQLMAFFLLIGFKSGVMPMRGGKAARKDEPISFWFAASCYGALLAFTLWFILTVLVDIARHGLN